MAKVTNPDVHIGLARQIAFDNMMKTLGEKFSRVDLTFYDLPTKDVYYYCNHKDCEVRHIRNMMFDPMPSAVVEHSHVDGFLVTGHPTVDRHPPALYSFFFDNDEDAVLFKMKYSGDK